MRRVREIIVVEGRYDKNIVTQAVSCTVLETSGFRIFSNTEKIALLRKLAQKRGIIILTDSDSAGFFIRGRLGGMLGGAEVKHAYIPDIKGREKRKASPSKEGKLGVEGMTREVIISALERAGATFDDEPDSVQNREPITKTDLFCAGLTGTPDSAARRREFSRSLGLPERLPANGLLDVLNVLYTRDEFLKYSQQDRSVFN